ncbi:dihydropyrimidinase [Roseinatronobacter monicus]|uniref:Dihydropyrimidinase n=1 Tax=Roseinatronobacter monicus TaxID=393481 RepID=A0A543KFF8_9RHOB|nr:dihydropyrimidinase [Roseinatronobacter monicus]TQM93804.1 dihydropyrimidinase [Roseinatronobacter monicus]
MLDLIIRNGTIATASEQFRADIGVKSGKIAALGHDLGPAHDVIDAAGKFVLPGGIDSHVHIAQPSGPGLETADDFDTATLSALFGGNTTVMSFCLQQKGESLTKAVADYHARAQGKLYTDVAFHLIVSDPTPEVLEQELPELIARGYRSVKVFMTYENLRLNDAQLLSTMAAAKDGGAVVMVHAENEDVIAFLSEQHRRAGLNAPHGHATSRPVASEREATHRAMTLADIADVPVVIVHVSNGPTIEEIARARHRGQRVVAETCPQYLFLTEDDLLRDGWEGAKFVCSPPPRDKAAQDACWRGLETGLFDLFSSDHCPFMFARDKLSAQARASYRHIPNGIPGVETRLPLLFSEGVCKSRIDLCRFVGLTATNHARTYGLLPRKGTVAIGADADLAVWNPQTQWTIANSALHGASDYSPYEGMRVQGRPETVILRGKVMIRDGALQGTSEDGTYLDRSTEERGPTLATGAATDFEMQVRAPKRGVVHAR